MLIICHDISCLNRSLKLLEIDKKKIIKFYPKFMKSNLIRILEADLRCLMAMTAKRLEVFYRRFLANWRGQP